MKTRTKKIMAVCGISLVAYFGAYFLSVRTGQWETYVPEPFEDTSFSNEHNRAASHDEQVLLLKAKGYAALADGLAAQYGG